MKSLCWKFDGSGEWEAESPQMAGATYRIQVCDDGTFDIFKCDRELELTGVKCLQSLANAKEVCRIREMTIGFSSQRSLEAKP